MAERCRLIPGSMYVPGNKPYDKDFILSGFQQYMLKTQF